TLSSSLAGGIVFQMDQTAFENPSFLWTERECGADSNLVSDLSLSNGCHHEKGIGDGEKSQRNSADCERKCLRASPSGRVTYKGTCCSKRNRLTEVAPVQ